MGRGGVYTGLWWGNFREYHLKDPGVDGRIILRWILMKQDGSVDWIDLAQDRDRWWGTCECGNEPSVSIKCGEFLN